MITQIALIIIALAALPIVLGMAFLVLRAIFWVTLDFLDAIGDGLHRPKSNDKYGVEGSGNTFQIRKELGQ